MPGALINRINAFSSSFETKARLVQFPEQRKPPPKKKLPSGLKLYQRFCCKHENLVLLPKKYTLILEVKPHRNVENKKTVLLLSFLTPTLPHYRMTTSHSLASTFRGHSAKYTSTPAHSLHICFILYTPFCRLIPYSAICHGHYSLPTYRALPHSSVN